MRLYDGGNKGDWVDGGPEKKCLGISRHINVAGMEVPVTRFRFNGKEWEEAWVSLSRQGHLSPQASGSGERTWSVLNPTKGLKELEAEILAEAQRAKSQWEEQEAQLAAAKRVKIEAEKASIVERCAQLGISVKEVPDKCLTILEIGVANKKAEIVFGSAFGPSATQKFEKSVSLWQKQGYLPMPKRSVPRPVKKRR